MAVTDGSNLTTRGIVRAIIDPVYALRTYKRLLYLVLAFPLTMLYWFLFGFGLLVGTFLSIILVGLVILLVMVPVVRMLITFERWLTNALLSISIEPTDDVETGDEIGTTIRGYLDAPSTWRRFGFLSLKFFLGIIGIVLLYGLVQGLSMISTIIRMPYDISFGEVNGEPLVWTIATFPEAILAVGLGIVLILVIVHLANGFGYVAGKMAAPMVGNSVRERTK